MRAVLDVGLGRLDPWPTRRPIIRSTQDRIDVFARGKQNSLLLTSGLVELDLLLLGEFDGVVTGLLCFTRVFAGIASSSERLLSRIALLLRVDREHLFLKLGEFCDTLWPFFFS